MLLVKCCIFFPKMVIQEEGGIAYVDKTDAAKGWSNAAMAGKGGEGGLGKW